MIRSLVIISAVLLPLGGPALAQGEAPEQGGSPPTTSASPESPGTSPTTSAAPESPGSTPTTPTSPGSSGSTSASPEIDQSIDRHRSPVDALNERMIGAASRSVRYDWRRANFGLVVIGSELLERNNFGSTRLGLLARKPFGVFMGELAVTRAFTWGTDSSEKLALTPYRQFGRPSRFELDVNVGYPVAEGVVTAWPGWFPATEVVLSGKAGFRYLFYPGAMGGKNFQEVAAAILAPQLTEGELIRLESQRLPGMQVDPARYGLLAGLSLDVYVQPGLLVSPRVLVSVPLLAPVTDSGLGFWWELTLGIGWMF